MPVDSRTAARWRYLRAAGCSPRDALLQINGERRHCGGPSLRYALRRGEGGFIGIGEYGAFRIQQTAFRCLSEDQAIRRAEACDSVVEVREDRPGGRLCWLRGKGRIEDATAPLTGAEIAAALDAVIPAELADRWRAEGPLDDAGLSERLADAFAVNCASADRVRIVTDPKGLRVWIGRDAVTLHPDPPRYRGAQTVALVRAHLALTEPGDVQGRLFA